MSVSSSPEEEPVAAAAESHSAGRATFPWDETRTRPDADAIAVHAPRRKVPELRLYAAILEDAWCCLTQPERVSQATHAAALAWVEGRTTSAPFCSFEEICWLLRLDAGAVRARLVRRGALRSRADVDPSPRLERRLSRTRA